MTTKTLMPRCVSMTSRVAAELRDLWQRSLKAPELRVFGVVDPKKGFARACKAAGIEGLRFHDLRHTAITRMIKVGIPDKFAMKASGHTQLTTFTRYINPDEQILRDIAEALERDREQDEMRRQDETLTPHSEEFVN